MKIKIVLKKSNPEYYEYILPIMSAEILRQIKDRKRTFIIDQDEYENILTELSAYMNHEDDFSDKNMTDVKKAIDDFTNSWSYVLEPSKE